MYKKITLIFFLNFTSLVSVTSNAIEKPSSKKSIIIGAASSLQEVLKKSSEVYLKQKKHKNLSISFNFAGSNTIVRQIQNGAAIDVFISADSINMNKLNSKNIALIKSRSIIAKNSLVIITSKKFFKSTLFPIDLNIPEIHSIAACPNAVPIGNYSEQYLQSINQLAPLKHKFVYTDNVRGIVSLVAKQAAQAGIVYKTDMQDKKNKEIIQIVFEVPLKEGPSIQYEAAIVSKSKITDTALSFINFLRSDIGQEIFSSFGFITIHG